MHKKWRDTERKTKLKEGFFNDLPKGVHLRIIQELVIEAPKPLFKPTYSAEYDCTKGIDGYPVQTALKEYTKLVDKSIEKDFNRSADQNYGPEHTDKDLARVKTLISLSTTCRVLRKLMAPILFDTVVLRSKPRSVRSLQCLQRSDHWNEIRSLMFVGTGEEYDYDEEGHADTEPSQRMQDEMSALRSILIDFPPNLESLTLDFPNARLSDHADQVRHHAGGSTSGKRLLKFTAVGRRYMSLIETVIEACSCNSLASKSKFELKLLSLPMFTVPTYNSPAFHQLLNHISSFTLSFGVWRSKWYIPKSYDPKVFLEKFEGIKSISSYFLNHLHNVTSLNIRAARAPRTIHASEAGFSPCTIPFDLPSSKKCMPKLREVVFANCMICRKMIRFLLAHSGTLERIALHDCFVGRWDESSPDWTRLFFSLVDASPPMDKLVDVNLSSEHVYWYFLYDWCDPELQTDDFDARIIMDVKDKICDIFDKEDVIETGLLQRAEDLQSFRQRRKRVLEHRHLYYMDRLETQNAFVAGQDHEAWLELVDMMYRNRSKRGAGVQAECTEFSGFQDQHFRYPGV